MKKILVAILAALSLTALSGCRSDSKVENYKGYGQYHLSIENIRDLRELYGFRENDNKVVEKAWENQNADYLVYIYAPWCGYCKEEKERMLELFDAVEFKNVYLLNYDTLRYERPAFAKELSENHSQYEAYNSGKKADLASANIAMALAAVNGNVSGDKQLDSISVPTLLRFAYTKEKEAVTLYYAKTGASTTGQHGAGVYNGAKDTICRSAVYDVQNNEKLKEICEKK